MTVRPRSFVFAILIAGLLAWLLSPLLAAAPADPPVVDPAVLESLLPQPDGWSVVRQQSKHVATGEMTHSFADAVFRNGAMNVRVTIADTGGNETSLIALATMVMTLPDDFTGEVPPATTIRRLTIAGYPAAERWNAADSEGEVSVLIGKRFVVAVDGTKLDAADTLRRIVDAIDLKKIAELD